MSPELRQQVRERAGGRCEYCRLPDWVELAGPFHVEHVVARQHRGTDVLSNLAWACSRCNRHKGTNLSGVDPDSDEVVTLFNPRRERWEEHFEIVGAIIRGRSPAGRVTAWLLQMNAERRVELRSELIGQGLWQA
ncbi:MAG: HNH endonuclease [Pedosphaera sp.]|nr:HNH endonuclease [Pedosphaera sp.]